MKLKIDLAAVVKNESALPSASVELQMAMLPPGRTAQVLPAATLVYLLLLLNPAVCPGNNPRLICRSGRMLVWLVLVLRLVCAATLAVLSVPQRVLGPAKTQPAVLKTEAQHLLALQALRALASWTTVVSFEVLVAVEHRH